MSLAHAFERRCTILLADIARLNHEMIADPPELGSTRRAAIVEKVGDLGNRFHRLSEDIRRGGAGFDARVAGLSRYVRGEAVFRERQRYLSGQAMFQELQRRVRDVAAAMKPLTDALARPPASVTAKGVHDLIEEFAKTVANYAGHPAANPGTRTTISMPAPTSVGADQVQGAADLLLLFGIFLRALYLKLKAPRP